MSEPVWVPMGAQSPGGRELAYVEATSNLTVTAGTPATAQTYITAGPVACDGQPIIVEFFTPLFRTPAVSSASAFITLFEDGIQIGRLAEITNTAAAAMDVPVLAQRKVTPSPGSHTYTIRSYVTPSGSGLIVGGPGGADPQWMPAYLRITQKDVVANVVPIGAPPLVTALPTSGLVDGMEVILTDSLTAGTYHWRLRYVAARATNKWVFIGGPPIYAEVVAADATATTTYVALTNAGPSIPLPAAGDYLVGVGFRNDSQGTADGTPLMSYDIGATGAVDADAASSKAINGSTGNQTSAFRKRKKTGLTAVTLTAKYRASGGNSAFAQRWMEVEPIALGG